MRIVTVVLIFLLAPFAWAEVYKWIDAEGVVHFSDEPVQGAEAVHIPPMQTISLPPVPQQHGSGRKASASESPYSSLTVSSPRKDEAIRANNGAVTVTLALTPSLLHGDRLRVTLDGVERLIETSSMNLSNLPRGGHTVQAAVVNAAGKVLISSEPVTFFVLRAHK